MLNGYIFVPEAKGLSDGYSDNTLKHLANVAKAHRVHEIIIESNFGDGMFMQLLKPWLNRIYPCAVSEVRNHTQKEKRIIDTLEPVLMQHRLVVDPRVIMDDAESTESDPAYSMFYQLARLTNERGALRHDDRLDCLAIMVQYWNEQMDADAKLLEQKRREELLEQELRDFIEHASGGFGGRSEPTWCNW